MAVAASRHCLFTSSMGESAVRLWNLLSLVPWSNHVVPLNCPATAIAVTNKWLACTGLRCTVELRLLSDPSTVSRCLRLGDHRGSASSLMFLCPPLLESPPLKTNDRRRSKRAIEPKDQLPSALGAQSSLLLAVGTTQGWVFSFF